MEITTVLFDLDGTLLPMDQEAFTKTYFKLLAAKLAPLGYEPGKLVESIWAGTAAMVKNDGSCLNEEAFWRAFAAIYGQQALRDRDVIDSFYTQEFNAEIGGKDGGAGHQSHFSPGCHREPHPLGRAGAVGLPAVYHL